ncbi:hypothetical protein AAVH_20045 [Aphelenchoides avenae]|nr:hypothetical protein AAVH_20045 [Aphelenchus avenae]
MRSVAVTWTVVCFAPGVEEVHYRDKIDAGEVEVTVQTRHLSELNQPHRSDRVLGLAQTELAWNALASIMAKQYGTYPTSQELDQFMDLIRERLQPDNDKMVVYRKVFSHLMFDRVYSEELRTNGLEPYEVSSPLPAIPAGLSDAAREQWIADFDTLVAHALKVNQPKTLNTSAVTAATVKDLRRMAPPSELRSASQSSQAIANELVQKLYATMEKLAVESVKSKNVRLGDKLPTSPPEKSSSAHNVSTIVHGHTANRELYAANKKLAAENASMKAKELGAGTGIPSSALNAAVAALLDLSVKSPSADEQKSEADNSEIVLLTSQLQKLDQSIELLQKQLIELREELTAARKQKKKDAKTSKGKHI